MKFSEYWTAFNCWDCDAFFHNAATHSLQATVELNINVGLTTTTFAVPSVTGNTVQDLHVS